MNSKGIKDLLKEAGLLIYHQQKGPIALSINTNTFKISSKSSFVTSKRDFFQKRKELSSKY
jgi:hypothetical protein